MINKQNINVSTNPRMHVDVYIVLQLWIHWIR